MFAFVATCLVYFFFIRPDKISSLRDFDLEDLDYMEAMGDEGYDGEYQDEDPPKVEEGFLYYRF